MKKYNKNWTMCGEGHELILHKISKCPVCTHLANIKHMKTTIDGLKKLKLKENHHE